MQIFNHGHVINNVNIFFFRLLLSGTSVKPERVPVGDYSTHRLKDNSLNGSLRKNEFDFLHEEIFAQDGVYEDIIAVDYKNM